jgi:hypothetical protein
VAQLPLNGFTFNQEGISEQANSSVASMTYRLMPASQQWHAAAGHGQSQACRQTSDGWPVQNGRVAKRQEALSSAFNSGRTVPCSAFAEDETSCACGTQPRDGWATRWIVSNSRTQLQASVSVARFTAGRARSMNGMPALCLSYPTSQH